MVDWKKRFFQFLKIAISLALIVWFVRLINGEDLGRALGRANLLYIGLVLVMANIDRLLMAYKWNLLLKAKDIHVPLRTVVGAYYKATFFGNLILPSVGADAVRIVEISGKTKKSSHIISSVVIERALGAVGLVVIGLFGLLLYTYTIQPGSWRNLALFFAMLVLLSAGFIVSINPRWWGWLQTWLANSKWRFVRKLETILVSYQDYAKQPRTILIFFLLTVFEQLFPVFNAYLVSEAIKAKIPFTTFLIFVPLIVAIVRLPISFDGFGVREALFISMFGLIGVPREEAFLVGFLPTVLARIATAPLTLFFFFYNKPVPNSADIEREPFAIKNDNVL